MFTILLSILCSTLVYSAPTDTVSWSTLKNDTSLTRFHSTLLNQTLITFLDECYSPQLTIKAHVPCSRYFDAILQLNRTDFIVEQPKVMKLLNETPTKAQDFCKQNNTFPPMEYYPTKINDFSDLVTCGIWCIDDNVAVKPICVFLAWMGYEIKSHSTAKPVEVPSLPENVPSLNDSDQPMLTNAGTSPDKTVSANTSNKTTQSTSSNTNIAQNTTTIAVAKPVDKDLQLADQKPASEVDLTKDKSNDHELNKALAAKAAAEIVASMGTAEKKQESTPTNAPPGTEIADEDQRIVDKQDSFDQPQPDDQPIENDSDMEGADQDEMDDDMDDQDIINQQIPPKGVKAIATSEPEQKSSLEIFDSNYLSKKTQKIDPFLEEPGSNFFTYFLFGMLLCIIMYVAYHNKSKILALLLEGRRSDKGRGGRRKHTAAYRKLDSNLEEAITSSASGRITQIIY